MAVRKRFFTKDIANKIKQDIINANTDLDIVNAVSIGNMNMLPSPSELSNRDTALMYLPAILIMPNNIANTTVNANKSISSVRYNFILRYIHYYDKTDTTTAMTDAMDNADLLASSLLEDHNLVPTASGTQYVDVLDSNDVVIGNILSTDVFDITYDTLDTEVFNALEIPVIIVDIEYQVIFRSLFKEG